MQTPRERLGQYEILGPLGAGGMGEVYVARDPVLGRKVAIKVLAVRLSGDRDTLTRFTQEARSASALNHPNIVTIHEVGVDNGTPFIVMECIEGQDLRTMLAGGPLPNRKTLEIASQIADGLAAAHEQGIIHRDLKPENLMYTKDGFVKILDFGLAKVVRATPGDEEETMILDMPGTNPGTILGTVGYMSPEQATGKPLDYRSDQFALGAILYELATGRPAFTGDNGIDILSAILHDEPPPLARTNPKMPQPFCWIVDRLLSKDSKERYDSTRDLARELRMLRERMATESSDVDIPPRRRVVSLPLRTAAIVLGVVIALAGAVWVGRDSLRLRPITAESDATSKKYLAVMRFKDLTGDRNGQLVVDGFAETLTARFAQLPGVQVMRPQTPNAALSDDRQRTVRELGANVILTGSILRNGDRLRIAYTLFDASSQRESGDTIDGSFSDLFGAQDRLAESVAGALHLGRRGAAVARASLPDDATSQRRYLEALGSMSRYDDEASVDDAIATLQSLSGESSASVVAALGRAYLYKYKLTHDGTWAARANETCEKAVTLDARNPNVHVTLGELRRLTGRHAEAVDAYKHALAENSNNADAVLGLAETYTATGAIDDAEREYRRAIALQPNFWGSYHKLGTLYLFHGQPAKSVAMFEKVRQLVPDNPRAYSYLGGAYQQMGDCAKAVSFFMQSIQLKPTAGAWSNIGTCRHESGDYAGAAEAYRKACELMPSNYVYRINLADALWFQSGMRAQATDAYARAAELTRADLAVNPRNAAARAALAVCLAKSGQQREAQEEIATALKLDPTNTLYLCQAAVVSNVAGDRAAAVRYLRSAIENGQNAAALRRDPEFANLRETDIFTPIPQQRSVR